MRVILDGSVCFDPFGGCYNYYRQVAPRLAAEGIHVSITPSPTGALNALRHSGPEVSSPLLPSGKWLPHGRLRKFLSKVKQGIERWRWSLRIRHSPQPTVFHSYYYGPPVNNEVAYIPMVMDMIQEKYPEWFGDTLGIQNLKAECVKRADRIIAISECTRRDVIEYYGVDPDKVDVIYLSINPSFYKPIAQHCLETFRTAFDLPKAYLLQVGGRACHKNFDRLLEAFSRYSEREDIHLVVAGAGWTASEALRIETLGLKSRVHLIQHPDQDTLVLLYRCAAGLVYPSVYEGFGLPPVEAMASGIPVAASSGGSIPEITAGAAALFDPLNVDSMVAAIERIRNPIEAERLRKLGERRCLDFSWDSIAKQTAQAYARVIRDFKPAGPSKRHFFSKYSDTLER
jgi:glycosyltransferase involved in cell wall biosynthesis